MTRPPPSQIVQSAAPEQPTRYHEGWRRGKPEEDPEKLKRWG